MALHFLTRVAARVGRPFDSVEPSSLDRLRACPWPGNIRQLQNVIEQCAVLCDGPRLYVPDTVLAEHRPAAAPTQDVGLTLEEMKRRYISQVLSFTGGSMPRAAAILGIDRRSLYRIVERYGIERPSRRPRGFDEYTDESYDNVGGLGEGIRRRKRPSRRIQPTDSIQRGVQRVVRSAQVRGVFQEHADAVRERSIEARSA